MDKTEKSELEKITAPMTTILGLVQNSMIAFGVVAAFFGLTIFAEPEREMVIIFLSLAAIIVPLEWVRRRTIRKLAEAWTKFYAGSTWETPAGERVTVTMADFSGNHLQVEFADGFEMIYAAGVLKPLDPKKDLGRKYMLSVDDKLLTETSKTKWRYLDGSVGIVRGASRDRHYDEVAFVDYITLKTENGVKRYQQTHLTPVWEVQSV